MRQEGVRKSKGVGMQVRGPNTHIIAISVKSPALCSDGANIYADVIQETVPAVKQDVDVPTE